MSLSSVSDIASVTKAVTAVAVLKLLADKQLSLQTPIAGYLPHTWQLGRNVNTITFEELLTQTSGTIEPNGTPFPDTGYVALKVTMSQPVYLTLPGRGASPKWTKQSCKQDYQQRLTGSHTVLCYQNANFALFRILIPYLNGFNDSGLSDGQIQTQTDSLYLGYMTSVFGNEFEATCTPAQGTSYVLVYPYPAGNAHGVDWGDWLDYCGGGGLQMSVTGMAHFLSHLMTGGYVPPAKITEMIKNLYGWDWKYTNTTYGTCAQKNGGLLGSGTQLSTILVYCPATALGFVGIANSRLGSASNKSGNWDSIVENAYNASWQ
jgi:CubicO group peptidase (beta-lactamase class C family)